MVGNVFTESFRQLLYSVHSRDKPLPELSLARSLMGIQQLSLDFRIMVSLVPESSSVEEISVQIVDGIARLAVEDGELPKEEASPTITSLYEVQCCFISRYRQITTADYNI